MFFHFGSKRDIYVKQLCEINQCMSVQTFWKFKIIPKNWCLCLKVDAVSVDTTCIVWAGATYDCDMGFCLDGFVDFWLVFKLKTKIFSLFYFFPLLNIMI